MKKTVYLFAMIAAFAASFLACDSTNDRESELTPDQKNQNYQSEVDSKFSQRWTAEERRLANTAASASYLSQVEKEVYYYLNLLRIDPPRFAETYAKDYRGVLGWINGYGFDERQQSLIQQLATLSPMPLLRPNEMLFYSAECFASNGGKLGNVGHDRSGTGCEQNVGLAECVACGGYVTGLSVVMDLLVDAGEGNALLGHRRILLDEHYEWMGVAVRDHRDFQHMVVMSLDSREL